MNLTENPTRAKTRRRTNAAGNFFAIGEIVPDAESDALCIKAVKTFVLTEDAT